jgi:predicted DNA-binding transcriptional regulator AlpA
MARTGTTTQDAIALTPKQVSKLLGISMRHLASLNSTGRIIRPIRLGRCLRYSADELQDWLAAGAPPRDKWEEMRDGGAA